MTLDIQVGARTDVGLRRLGNEDAFLADAAQHLYAVADGMGGHQGGEVASSMALETIRSKVAEGAALEGAVVQANGAVLTRASGDPELEGMGCTLTAVTFPDQQTARFAHVGDSRAYLLRQGELTQITEDHSVVGELVRGGRLTREQAAIHPHRSMLTRALGIEEPLRVDSYDVDVLDGDRIMLCSDGLTAMVPDDAIERTLRKHHNPERAAVTLVDMANKAGGVDNITVVVLDMGGSADGSEQAGASDAESGDGEPTGHWEPGDGLAAPPTTDQQQDLGNPSARGPDGDQDDRLSTTGEEPPPPRGERHRRGRAARIALYLIPALVVIGLGMTALGWYARSTYFVGLDNHRVTIFRGVPNGLLGWDPTVERRSGLTDDRLTQAQRSDLRHDHRFGDRSAANRFVKQLERSADQRVTAAIAVTTTTAAAPAPVAPPPA